MVELRSLLIVDGTVHVDLNRPRTDKARRAGNVIAAGYFKRARDLTILHTPWGRLVDPANLEKVEYLITQAAKAAKAHNREYDVCRVESTLIWELLEGNRRQAVIGWVDRKLRERDREVWDALALLQAAAAGQTAEAARHQAR